MKSGEPNGCSAITLATACVGSSVGPSTPTKATPRDWLFGREHDLRPSGRHRRGHGQAPLDIYLSMWNRGVSILRQLCDDDRVSIETISSVRRWSMLVIALSATLCANVFINGAAFLIPTLHTERGLDLAKAGLLSSMASFGMVATLIAWGYIVDRVGERIVLALGSALTAGAAFAAASVHSLVAVGAFLLLGGMAAASGHSASGRLVVGWFPPERRGLVMGIRQTAQPLGIGLGALVIPRLAEAHGVSVALLFPAVVCAVSAVVCAVAVVDPPRPPRHEADEAELANPYRGSSTAVAHPRRVGSVGGSPGRGVDVHAGVADERPRLVSGVGGRDGDGRPDTGRRWTNRRGTLVGHRGFATAPDSHHRAGGSGGDGSAGADRLAQLPRQRGGDGDRLGDHGVRQRLSVHRDRRDRRAVLERPRTRHAEHESAVDRRRRAASCSAD